MRGPLIPVVGEAQGSHHSGFVYLFLRESISYHGRLEADFEGHTIRSPRSYTVPLLSSFRRPIAASGLHAAQISGDRERGR
jgi:hypothetical protein